MLQVRVLGGAVAAAGLSLLALGAAGCGGGGGGAGGDIHGLVQIVTASLPGGETGAEYSAAIEIQVAHPPGVVSLAAGTIPPGLKLDAMSGVLSGYPRQLGSFNFTLVARDGPDPDLPPGRDVVFAEDRQSFVVTIGRGPVNLLPQTVAPAEYRNTYAYQFDVSGGTAPYRFDMTGGALPSGLTLLSGGMLQGVPTQASQDPYEFQITVTDANGQTDTDTFGVLVVVLPLVIGTSSPLPAGAKDFPYDVPLTLAIKGGGAPYTWSQVAPGPGETALSAVGMEISANGHVRNSFAVPGPTQLGTYRFTARVTDEPGQVATRQYQITFNPGPVLSSLTPRKAAQPGPYTATGLNFQPGCQLVFAPGPDEVSILPTFVNSTTLTFSTAPGQPTGARGFVPVRVLNPDGGYYDLAAGFAWPLTNVRFSTTPVFPTPQSGLSSTGLAVADLNKDGKADVVHTGSGSAAYYWGDTSYNMGVMGSAGGVDLMLNSWDGTGTFGGQFTRVQLDGDQQWHQVALGDLDNDGDLDIVAVGVVGGSLRARVWLNPYPAAYTAATPYLDSTLPFRIPYPWYGSGRDHVTGLALAQLTPDSALDLVYSEVNQQYNSSNSSTVGGGSVMSVQGLGNGRFGSSLLQVCDPQQATQIVQLMSVSGVAAGRLNGDTTDDIAVSDQAGGFVAFQFGGTYGENGQAAITNPSTGLFGSWTPLYAGSAYMIECLDTEIADFNGDGNGDIAFTTGPAYSSVPLYNITVFQGNSGGTGFTYVPVQQASGSPLYRFLHAFDANFDQPMDAVASASTRQLMVWSGRTGTAGLEARQTLDLTGGSPSFGRVASGDFNGDGLEDICAAMSFLHDNGVSGYYFYYGTPTGGNPRALGSPQGFVIFLNTSN